MFPSPDSSASARYVQARNIKAPADLSSQYGATAMIANIDAFRDELLAENPGFAAFLGAGGNQVGASQRGQRRQKKPRQTKKRKIMTEADQKLGEATLAYASEDFERAIELLREVIRLSPNNPVPYQTLGTIYTELDKEKTALDFLMIAAHLSRRDGPLWHRLARMSVRLQNPRQALYCLSQALRLDPDNVDNRWDQATLYLDIGEPRRAMEHLEVLRRKLPDNADAAVELARVQHSLGMADKAEATLDEMMADHPEKVSPTLVNILAELKMERGKFAETVALIESVRGQMQSLSQETAENNRQNPLDMPLDLTVRLGMALLYLGRGGEAKAHMDKLRMQDVKGYEDLYMDAAETCWAVGQVAEAEILYTALRASAVYDQPALWTKIAACIHAGIIQSASNTENAAKLAADGVVEFYTSVLTQHPESLNAKTALAEGLINAGRKEEVMATLPPPSELGSLDRKDALHVLAIHRRTAGDADFLDLALPLVRESLEAGTWTEVPATEPVRGAGRRGGGRWGPRKKVSVPQADSLFKGYQARDRSKRAREEKRKRQRQQQQQQDEDEDEENDQHEARDEDVEMEDAADPPAPTPANDGVFELVLQVAHALFTNGRLKEAAAMMDDCMTRHKLAPSQSTALRYLRAHVAMSSGDAREAFEDARVVATNHPHSPEAWNVYAHLAVSAGSIPRCIRALSRTVERLRQIDRKGDAGDGPEAAPGEDPATARAAEMKHVPALVMSGLMHSLQGAWGPALGDLMQAVALAPREPAAALAAGVAALHFAARAFNADAVRHAWTLRAAALLQHAAALRSASGHPQEGDYNLARGLHQLGLVHLARPLYERCLEGESSRGEVPTRCEGANLRWEAAHNLALIYKASGAPALARAVLRKHATI